jgi:hypothetical protein
MVLASSGLASITSRSKHFSSLASASASLSARGVTYVVALGLLLVLVGVATRLGNSGAFLVFRPLRLRFGIDMGGVATCFPLVEGGIVWVARGLDRVASAVAGVGASRKVADDTGGEIAVSWGLMDSGVLLVSGSAGCGKGSMVLKLEPNWLRDSVAGPDVWLGGDGPEVWMG